MGLIWMLAQVAYIAVCLGLIFLVLIQESKGEGLSGVFGGGGGSQTLFGSSAPTVVHKATIWCAVLFMGLGFLLMFHVPTRRAPTTVMEGITAPPVTTGAEEGEEATEGGGETGAVEPGAAVAPEAGAPAAGAEAPAGEAPAGEAPNGETSGGGAAPVQPQ